MGGTGKEPYRNKRILVITHQLSRTGAPIVLLDMVKVLQGQGYQIEMITMLDGELRQEFQKMGIPVRVQERFIAQAEEFLQYAHGFQMVVANTLITFEPVQLLKYTKIPVLWWLHEGRRYFEHFQTVLPDFSKLPSNIHVLAVGHTVQQAVWELYGVQVEILHFGVEDFPVVHKREMNDGKVRFLTAGMYSKIKGQDVLAEAIRQLPEEYLTRAEFFFCGNEQMYDEEVFSSIQKLCEDYENVTILHQLSRAETLAWMERCDCLIVPSRMDAMPTVAAEMMMKGNLCLCTDVCGVAYYIEDGRNGFTVPSANVEALVEKITYIVDNNKRLSSVRSAGRKTYEAYFSKDVFADRVQGLAERYMHIDGLGKEKDRTMGSAKTTVVITSYNQKDALNRCLEWLKGVQGIANIIVVDNGSTDGTAELVPQLGYDNIIFDEGIQGCGKVWNAVVDNFELEDTVLFMTPGYYLGRECIRQMAMVLEQETCGIVGPVSNGLLFFQHCDEFQLGDIQGAEQQMLCRETMSYRALCLEDSIWMLSKSILDAELFDASLVQPEHVLQDLELRIARKGYCPRVCYRALAFCDSSELNKADYEGLLGKCDRDVLKDKWDMNYFNLIPSTRVVNLMEEEREAPIRVLEVGCDLGATLLEIKNRYPNSQLYGLEINPASAEIAKCFAKVEVGNIEDEEFPFEGEFDCIIFGDVLEHLRDPQKVVRYCRQKLTEHGYILTSIPNLMHISVMEQLLHGRFHYDDVGLLDRSHIHLFTYYEIQAMFQAEGYNVEEVNISLLELTQEQEGLISKLMAISENVDEQMYRAFQYILRARKAG